MVKFHNLNQTRKENIIMMINALIVNILRTNNITNDFKTPTIIMIKEHKFQCTLLTFLLINNNLFKTIHNINSNNNKQWDIRICLEYNKILTINNIIIK